MPGEGTFGHRGFPCDSSCFEREESSLQARQSTGRRVSLPAPPNRFVATPPTCQPNQLPISLAIFGVSVRARRGNSSDNGVNVLGIIVRRIGAGKTAMNLNKSQSQRQPSNDFSVVRRANTLLSRLLFIFSKERKLNFAERTVLSISISCRTKRSVRPRNLIVCPRQRGSLPSSTSLHNHRPTVPTFTTSSMLCIRFCITLTQNIYRV